MSEQKFPGRIWITNPDTDFLRMQNLGPQHEWIHLSEHQAILSEEQRLNAIGQEQELKIFAK